MHLTQLCTHSLAQLLTNYYLKKPREHGRNQLNLFLGADCSYKFNKICKIILMKIQSNILSFFILGGASDPLKSFPAWPDADSAQETKEVTQRDTKLGTSTCSNCHTAVHSTNR